MRLELLPDSLNVLRRFYQGQDCRFDGVRESGAMHPQCRLGNASNSTPTRRLGSEYDSGQLSQKLDLC